MEYKAGVTKSVRSVAKLKPKTMVAAMPPKTTSKSNGIMPKIVVMAAIRTGRTRETVDSMMA